MWVGEPAGSRPGDEQDHPVLAEKDSAEQAGEAGENADEAAAPDEFPVERPEAEPVQPVQRVQSVDVLRGFALLGILAMNIVHFGWGGAVYMDPTRGGGFEGINRAIWVVNHLIFDMKMMTLFSMLFGAGLVLMGERADARGARLAGIYYRRVLWLLVIGLAHAYFIWSGDILVAYAQCGFLLYPFRKRSAKFLIILGTVLLCLMVPFMLAIRGGIYFLKNNESRVAAAERAAGIERPAQAEGSGSEAEGASEKAEGREQTEGTSQQMEGTAPEKGKAKAKEEKRHVPGVEDWRVSLADLWREKLHPKFDPSPEKRAEKLAKEISIYGGRDYGDQVRDRLKNVVGEQVIGFLVATWWMIGGRMLLGMGLAKAGIFSGTRSRRFYWLMMLLGYGVGMPMLVYDTVMAIRSGFDLGWALNGGMLLYPMAAIPTALGHVGLVMLIYQSGGLKWLTDRLAAVGRMALTNYLTHSIVCTAIFYGWGLGLFGKVDRWGLALIVLGIWVFQLIISPIWLKHFRYGPAEWLWRTLTYWKPQPMRIGQVEMATGIARG
jgi:uncharacterized protein